MKRLLWRIKLSFLACRFLLSWWSFALAWKMTENEWAELYEDGQSPMDVIRDELYYGQ